MVSLRKCWIEASGVGLQIGHRTDCGTNSSEQANELKEKGIDLIVVDHHQAKGDLPEGPIMVNPHLHPDHGEPWRNLCTAGLAFKLFTVC